MEMSNGPNPKRLSSHELTTW